MSESVRHSAAGAAATDLILETFRLNGLLLEAGEQLVRDLGLTSARWQVLGAIAGAVAPQSVAQIARSMGLTRQAVQRLANEMAEDGLVRFADNPQHERAKLVLLTPRGEQSFARATARQIPWANAVAQGTSVAQLRSAVETLRALRARLERGERG